MSLDDSRRPQKRQRIDGDEIEQQASSSFTRSKFWFDDGNIVLQTEDMQFRVHRSMLSFHSSVFKDMFEMPQPAHSEDAIIEGCPVVPLSDSSEDLEIVLSILFDNVRTSGMFEQIAFAEVRAMLRLGTKYEIDYLKRAALKMFHHDFPTSFSDWVDLGGKDFHISQLVKDLIPMVDMMLDFSLRTPLPCAYLVVVTQLNLDDLIVEAGKFPEIVFSCMKGREKIFFWLKNLHLSWSKKVIESGFSPQCRKASLCPSMARSKILDDLKFWPKDGEPLALFWDDNWTAPESTVLCTMCVKALENVHKDIRLQTWTVLPTFFGLPAWKDLKDQ